MIGSRTTRRIVVAILGIAIAAGAKAIESMLLTRQSDAPRTRTVTLHDHCAQPYQIEKRP